MSPNFLEMPLWDMSTTSVCLSMWAKWSVVWCITGSCSFFSCLTKDTKVEEANLALISPNANCIPIVLLLNPRIHGPAPFLIFGRAELKPAMSANFHGLYTAFPSGKLIGGICVDVIVFLLFIGFLVWVRVTDLLGFWISLHEAPSIMSAQSSSPLSSHMQYSVTSCRKFQHLWGRFSVISFQNHNSCYTVGHMSTSDWLRVLVCVLSKYKLQGPF